MRTPPPSGRLPERPADGAAADPQRPGDLGHGDVPGLTPRPGQGDLGWGELGRTAAHAAAGPRGSPAHRRPLDDQLPLELGQRGEDAEDQSAGAGSGVDPLMQANATPRSASALTVSTRCRSARPSRSSRHTTSVSPARRYPRHNVSSGRPVSFPDAVSAKIFWQPAAVSASVCPAAAAANSEDEFFARLGQAGVLVRKRFSIKNPGQVTGYSVALPGDTAKTGGPVWYGGGKLAADLTWPKLRQRWTPDRATPGRLRPDLTAGERNAIWEHATRTAADATAQIRTLTGTATPPSATRQHRRPARRAVLPRTSPA